LKTTCPLLLIKKDVFIESTLKIISPGQYELFCL
jgi:hypothetical protein